MTGGIRVSVDPEQGWRAELPASTVARRRAASRFLDVLDNVPFLHELSIRDRHLSLRVDFNHACHYMAEAACRLSDHSRRHPSADPDLVSPGRLATGYLVLGLRQMHKIADRLEWHIRAPDPTTPG